MGIAVCSLFIHNAEKAVKETMDVQGTEPYKGARDDGECLRIYKDFDLKNKMVI